MWRIGWLSPSSAETGVLQLDALRQGLRELNYVEGRTLMIEARWADEEPERLPQLARALVDLKVDIICPKALGLAIPRSVLMRADELTQ